MASTYLSWFSGRDTTNATSIKEAYSVFFEMLKIQHGEWQQSHLFALPAQYEAVVSNVSQAVRPLDGQKKNELLLKERSVADFVFTLYEQNLYLVQHARSVGDEERSRFLGEVQNYLTGRVLRNPRLLWYWSASGGGLSEAYEEATRKHYEANVLRSASQPLSEKPDPVGPFH